MVENLDGRERRRRARGGLEIAKIDAAIKALGEMRGEIAGNNRPIAEIIERAAQEGIDIIEDADRQIKALQDPGTSPN